MNNLTVLYFKGLDGLPYEIVRYPIVEMESPEPVHIAAWFIRAAKEWSWKVSGRRRVAEGDQLKVGTRAFVFGGTGEDIPGWSRLKLQEIATCNTR